MSSEEQQPNDGRQLLLKMEELCKVTPLEDISPAGVEALKVLSEEVRRIAMRMKRDGNSHDITERALHLMSLFNVEPTVPIGWSKNSGTPYYKEKYALRVKAILDIMITDETKDRIIDPTKMKMTRESIKAMLTQGWLWLIDKHGKASVYADMRSRIKICQVSDGIKLVWAHVIPPDGTMSYTGDEHSKATLHPRWKDELITWIEQGEDGTKFEKSGVTMTPEQLEYIKNLVNECMSSACIIVGSLKTTKVLLIKDKTLYTDSQQGKV
jgi:hypothetical protein